MMCGKGSSPTNPVSQAFELDGSILTQYACDQGLRVLHQQNQQNKIT